MMTRGSCCRQLHAEDVEIPKQICSARLEAGVVFSWGDAQVLKLKLKLKMLRWVASAEGIRKAPLSQRDNCE